MKLLLDTHIFLWLNSAPQKLSIQARQLCEDTNNQLYLSLVSLWEIQIKQQLGKLELKQPLHRMLEVQQRDNALQTLPIVLEHIYALAKLPQYHNDPFDRLLIAQAMVESMTLITVDEKILTYSIATIN